jgi:hypothetical protein
VLVLVKERNELLLPFLPLVLAGATYLLGRTDEFHLEPLALALVIMLAIGAARTSQRALHWSMIGIVAVIALHGIDRKVGQVLHARSSEALAVSTAHPIRLEVQQARRLTALTDYVRVNVPVGEPIFVANGRHDRVRVGNPLLYTVLARPNPTRYDVMQPGVVTTAAVQREIVSDLEYAKPKVIIRWLDPSATADEGNDSAKSSGVRILDSYITLHYYEHKRFGYYAVWMRR